MWSKELFNCSSYQMISRAAIAFAIQNLLTFELLHSLADLPGGLAGSVAVKGGEESSGTSGNFEAWNKTVNNMNVLQLRWLARLLFLFRKSCNNFNLLLRKQHSLLKIKLGSRQFLSWVDIKESIQSQLTLGLLRFLAGLSAGLTKSASST
jgi:hypothetical protein